MITDYTRLHKICHQLQMITITVNDLPHLWSHMVPDLKLRLFSLEMLSKLNPSAGNYRLLGSGYSTCI